MRFIFALMALFAWPAAAADPPAAPDNTVYLDLAYGRVVIHMRPDLAPRHVARLKHLIRGGYYDGMVFYRVLDTFAAQTGDIKGDGTGAGTGRTLNAEFSRTPQVRGTVSMARTSRRNSADAEWFIVLDDNSNTRSSLDGKYTVWGQVSSGMEFVDQIPKGDPAKDGRGIAAPAQIVRMQIAADADASSKLDVAALLKRPDAAETARDFSAADFRCSGLVHGRGVTSQSALAQLWTHGYLAGRYAAGNALSLIPGEAGELGALIEACAAQPLAFLTAAGHELAKTPRPLPATTPVLDLETATCRQFADSRKAKTGEADLAGLWTFGFIEGYKSVSQPEMGIPWDARPRLLDAMATACAKFPDRKFFDLATAVAAKVRIK
ncbi:MAG: peptidylprolyl isomerase [Rhodospirillaceae bacterium]